MVKIWVALLGIWTTSLALSSSLAAAQLTLDFYEKSCPSLTQIVKTGVASAIRNETRVAASLLRLHFHDCFVQGCDASILLDDAGPAHSSEKDFPPNVNSMRGFEEIDRIKAAVESSCPNVVSCADIVTLAAMFSVFISGGPRWPVTLGRRDSLSGNPNLLDNIPRPSLNVAELTENFAAQNLTAQDMVALVGAHTIGFARCISVTSRLFNFSGTPGLADPSINASLLAALERSCPHEGNSNVTVHLDIRTPQRFDHLYFTNLLQHNGVLNSDAQLTAADDTKAWVDAYAGDRGQFFRDFVPSMIKLGNLNVLTGTDGEIRKDCRVRNAVGGY